MYKVLTFFVLMFISCFNLYSQDQEQKDILYLKNGKNISGVILKQEFGVVSLKITDESTREEKVLQIQQYEINKIVRGKSSIIQTDTIQALKEGDANIRNSQKQPFSDKSILSEQTGDLLQPELVQQNMILQPVPKPDERITLPDIHGSVSLAPGQTVGVEENFDPYSIPRPKRQPRLWNRDIRGFRGFIDYAYIQGIGKAKNHRLEFGTSLGFQFNPIFYTGIGTSYTLTLNSKDSSLPVFINPRINFLDENTTPFWDVKVGYSVGAGKGIYFSTGFGVSFTKQGKRAFNLSLIYSLQNAKFYEWSDKDPPTRIGIKETYHGIALKLSYEFGIGR